MLCLEATKQLQLALTGRSKHQASGAVISEDRSQRWTFLLPVELGGWIEADITLLLFHVGGVNFYNFRLRSAPSPHVEGVCPAPEASRWVLGASAPLSVAAADLMSGFGRSVMEHTAERKGLLSTRWTRARSPRVSLSQHIIVLQTNECAGPAV